MRAAWDVGVPRPVTHTTIFLASSGSDESFKVSVYQNKLYVNDVTSGLSDAQLLSVQRMASPSRHVKARSLAGERALVLKMA